MARISSRWYALTGQAQAIHDPEYVARWGNTPMPAIRSGGMVRPSQRTANRPRRRGRPGNGKRCFRSSQPPLRSWHRIEALPRPALIALWLLLVLVFLAGPMFLLLFLPVAAMVAQGDEPLAHLRHVGLEQPSVRDGRLDVRRDARVPPARGPAAHPTRVRVPRRRRPGLHVDDALDEWCWMVRFRMRFRGHTWRMANEMSLAMVAPIVGCFGLVRSGSAPSCRSSTGSRRQASTRPPTTGCCSG